MQKNIIMISSKPVSPPVLGGLGGLIMMNQKHSYKYRYQLINPLIFLTSLLLFSCEKSALFNSGDTITKEIILAESFTSIEVKNLFDIKLVNDTLNKVVVTCGEKLMPDLKIFVQDGTLFLDETLENKWSRKYDKIKLELHVLSIKYINVRKPCHIFTVDTFKSDNFILIDWGKFVDLDVCLDVHSLGLYVSSDDYGIYRLQGKANYAEFVGRGSVFVQCNRLNIQNCTVSHEGIGDIYLNVSKRLTARLKSSGNIYYKGNPEIIVEEQSSSGKLILWND